MKDIMNFIVNNWNFFSTIIGTVIGGVIALVSSLILESHRERRTVRRAKITDILIPYGIIVEKTRGMTSHPEDAIDFDSNASTILDELSQPCDYLRIEKRVYLNKSQKAQLTKYRDLLRDYNDDFHNKFLSLHESYEKCLSAHIKEQNITFKPLSSVIVISDDDFENHLSWFVITGVPMNLSSHIHGLLLIYEDDNGENKNSVSFSKSVREAYEEILAEAKYLEDYNNDEQFSLRLFDALSQFDEEKWFSTMTSFSKINDLHALDEQLGKIQNNIEKEVDKLTK